MLVKDFLKKAFMLRAGSDDLIVHRYNDGAPLTVVNLRKTYFSPTEYSSVFELDFNTVPSAWTLGELTKVLLTATLGGEINVDKCEIGGNATDKWIEV